MRTATTVRLLLGGLCITTLALAASVQAAPAAPAPPPGVAPAAPARPYPPPPPRLPDQPPPFDYPFTPQVAAVPDPDPAESSTSDARDYSGLNGGLALGPGGLFGPGENALALSYLLRLGYGIERDLMFVLSYEGAGTTSVNPKTKSDSWLSQDILSLAFQGRLRSLVYLRGGLGVGSVSEKTDTQTFSGGRGLAVLGAVGRDIFVREHLALAVELNATYTRYPRESWKTGGLQLVASFF
jgi:hypothetical protein